MVVLLDEEEDVGQEVEEDYVGGEGGGQVNTYRSMYLEMQEAGGRCWG